MITFPFIILLLYEPIISKHIFVFEQFRHGGRGSIFVVPSDYVDRYEVDWGGNGELSALGMRQHYLIGVRSRFKYKNFLSQKYDPKDMLIYSTDQNRTILSAQAQLLGMFPPKSGNELDEHDLKFALPPNPITPEMQNEIDSLGNNALPKLLQVIPIQLFGGDNKKYYTLTEASECAIMKQIKEKYEKKQIVQDFYREFNNTYGDKLKKYFGQNNTDFLFNYYNLLGITDHFISNYEHRKNLTKFREYGFDLEEFNKKCKEFKTLSFFEIESDMNIGVMAMSPTLKNIIKWMENRIYIEEHNITVRTSEYPKYVMYSGHDYTIVPLEQYLNTVFGCPMHYPEFAANQFFELHKSDYDSNYYYVEYFYNDELLLNVSFQEFKKEIESVMWSKNEIDTFCRYGIGKYFWDYAILASCLILLVVFILNLRIMFYKYHQRKANRTQFQHNKTLTNITDEEGKEMVNVNLIQQ
jgi:lysosomal acid phosphatase